MMGDRKAHLFITVEVLVAIQSSPLFPASMRSLLSLRQKCHVPSQNHCCVVISAFLQATVQTRVGYLTTCLC